MPVLDTRIVERFGPFHRVESSPGEHAGSQVCRAVTESGVAFFIKRLTPRGFQQESNFYRSYSLSRSPKLLACFQDILTLVLTSVPGTPVSRSRRVDRATVYQSAGKLLEEIHRLRPLGQDKLPLHQALEKRLTSFATHAEMHLAKDVIKNIVNDTTDLLDHTRLKERVPCHRDFMEHNWLVTDQGELSIIDFEHARCDFWILDFCQMNALVWVANPDLKSAFFHGYQHQLDSWEEAFLKRWSLIWSYQTLFWARAHRDERYEKLGMEAVSLLSQ